MGLRDLFRRGPREVDWTSELGERSRPAPRPADASADVAATAPGDVRIERGPTSVSVTSTTIGPDGEQRVLTGEEALAQIPPAARRQLEALGLDRFVTGEAGPGGAAPAMGFGDMLRALKAMPGMTASLSDVQASMEAGTTAGATPPQGSSDDPVERLRALGELRDRGVLTEDEFATLKQRIVDGPPSGPDATP